MDIFNLGVHAGQNLVDTLTGQSVVVGDLLKARSSSPLGNNFPVSVRVLPRARLQRSPLPSGDEVESLDALVGQEVRPVALPNVTNIAVLSFLAPLVSLSPYLNLGETRAQRA